MLCTMILQEKLNLREGTLLDGTVKKILPYGAQIKLGKTNRRSVTAWILIDSFVCVFFLLDKAQLYPMGFL